jgi:hypothetical protein
MDKYANLLENAMSYHCNENDYITYFGRKPAQRDVTFKYCLDFVNNIDNANIVELGTSRSFVDGRFPGAENTDTSLWQPENPNVWDWSSGLFTRVFSECTNPNVSLTTVDLDPKGIYISKVITSKFADKIKYHCMSSEDFLSQTSPNSIDLLYLDTGYVNPVEATALLHLREAKIIVQRSLLKHNGIILIDDVKNLASKTDAKETSDYSKAKYSIPYFLNNGYEIVMDEYQVILKKKNV